MQEDQNTLPRAVPTNPPVDEQNATAANDVAIGPEPVPELLEVSITVAEPAWDEAAPDCRDIARAAATAGAAGQLDGDGAEISIVLAGDEMLRELNRRYRGIDASTNVLSFADGTPPPAPGVERLLGDVAVSLETTRQEAEAEGLEITEHLAHLVVHGVLHLLGYDHETDVDAVVMERLETSVLAGLGLKDPYGRG